ncbi:MAG: chlororespiratory reduction protein 7 [Cyanobacteria bacterium P01_A01_bin.45]
MSDSLMYEQDYFVVLQTNQAEQFLTTSELLEKLKSVLKELPEDELPLELQNLDSLETQAQYLIDTSCELDLKPGEYLQWYAVRLEK